jgi:hypothetical protein
MLDLALNLTLNLIWSEVSGDSALLKRCSADEARSRRATAEVALPQRNESWRCRHPYHASGRRVASMR